MSGGGVIEPNNIRQVQERIKDNVLKYHRAQLRSLQEAKVEKGVRVGMAPVMLAAPMAIAYVRPLVVGMGARLRPIITKGLEKQ